MTANNKLERVVVPCVFVLIFLVCFITIIEDNNTTSSYKLQHMENYHKAYIDFLVPTSPQKRKTNDVLRRSRKQRLRLRKRNKWNRMLVYVVVIAWAVLQGYLFS